MAHKWIATKFKGIRYREHPTRKHGRQPDRYFNVRFQVAGVSVNEGYGWASEGMSASKAALLIAELKEDLRTGNGTGKLADRRKAREDAEQDATEKKQEQKRIAITYAQYFNERYLSSIQSKKPSTKAREISLHELWILPAMGGAPIKDICLLDIRRVKQNMEKKGLAPRSVQYVLPAFVWSYPMQCSPNITLVSIQLKK